LHPPQPHTTTPGRHARDTESRIKKRGERGARTKKEKPTVQGGGKYWKKERRMKTERETLCKRGKGEEVVRTDAKGE